VRSARGVKEVEEKVKEQVEDETSFYDHYR
jgi:hypothetical protein